MIFKQDRNHKWTAYELYFDKRQPMSKLLLAAIEAVPEEGVSFYPELVQAGAVWYWRLDSNRLKAVFAEIEPSSEEWLLISLSGEEVKKDAISVELEYTEGTVGPTLAQVYPIQLSYQPSFHLGPARIICNTPCPFTYCDVKYYPKSKYVCVKHTRTVIFGTSQLFGVSKTRRPKDRILYRRMVKKYVGLLPDVCNTNQLKEGTKKWEGNCQFS